MHVAIVQALADEEHEQATTTELRPETETSQMQPPTGIDGITDVTAPSLGTAAVVEAAAESVSAVHDGSRGEAFLDVLRSHASAPASQSLATKALLAQRDSKYSINTS
jgi:hypothetical protein